MELDYIETKVHIETMQKMVECVNKIDELQRIVIDYKSKLNSLKNLMLRRYDEARNLEKILDTIVTRHITMLSDEQDKYEKLINSLLTF